ncbi:MAG TPA: C25 family cysteine peptidase [Candidatus Syntrophosphaera sp.]|nr:C25 family cysteine peptidase [Candidatus Syntrophosphaera sp.]
MIKKVSLVLMLGLSLSAILAFNDNILPQSNHAFQITTKSTNYLDIQFTLPSYDITEEEANGNTYQRIMMPESGTTLESGLPELPTLSIMLAIPRQGSVQIETLNSQTEVLAQFLPYPVQEEQNSASPKSFLIDNAFYENGVSYPANLIQISNPVILRDFRLVGIQVNPFSYNPQSHTLTINQSISFRVNYLNEPGINELEGELQSISPAFANIYESIIFNFDDYRNLIDSHIPPRYLIIYGNNTDTNYIAALNSFVLWKKQKGADVSIASTANNEAGSSTTSIKTYIQNAYNNPDTRPDYVILIGDTSGSYTIPCFTYSGGSTDYPYTHLAGSDILGDVFIGRISAENLSQLQTLFAKIYLYERDINLNNAQWLNRMLLIGDYSPSGISTTYISKFIKESALAINPDYTFTELYGDNPPSSEVNSAINTGVGFHSYRGYISMSGWSPSESLNNAYRMPHAVLLTCGTGNFNSTASTETYIRLGSAAQPKGAITAMGMATSSTKTVFNNVLHGGIFGGILQHNMRTPGEAMLNGKLFAFQVYGLSSSYNNEHTHWLNLMGDPTVEIYCGIPNHFNITSITSIPLGQNYMDVFVTDATGVPVKDACVTLTQNNSIIGRGYTDEDGNVVLILSSDMTVSPCVLTVSKHNFKPLQQNIAVDNFGTLVPGTIIVDDDNEGLSQGNSDGLVDAGETIELLLGLRNTSATSISGISGYLSSRSPYVSIVDSLLTYEAIAPSALGFNNNPVVVNIAANTPNEAMIRFHLMLTDSNNVSYDVSEFVTVNNAEMIFNSYQVIDEENQVLDPGENVEFTITVINQTATPITDIYGRLYTLNDLINVTDNTAFYGDLFFNIEVTPTTDNFQLYGRPMLLPGMIIPMRLKLYNSSGFEQWLDFSLTIGEVTVDDPLGPDSYGYVIYDDQDTDYEECPLYNWIEIAPAEGGLGTALPITDAYTGGDEGDQVGANALAIVELPFPFQFYGQVYDQITVCSNGFIAMGATENGEFRNYRLPGPMGPSPMIAPFWDDLATHAGGGIYTWYDRNNHSFVIEWYNLKNGSNGSSLETFEVILYDQSMYPTSLGDGPIKFQYQTFNNVDMTSGNRHGCYATIGIEDHTGTMGLEYTFNNVYPTAASPLGNQRALYITNVPLYYYDPHIILNETYIDDNNGNGVCEPGETIRLGIKIQNIGNQTAENITATLSTNNPYINILTATGTYYSLTTDSFGVNQQPFVFTVAPECPNGTVVNFHLLISSGEFSWQRNFTVRIEASVLEFFSYLINDADANFNGIIEPLETVKIIVNVYNHSDVQSREVMATLSTSSSDVMIVNPIINLPLIEPNTIMQFVFEVQFTGVSSLSQYISMQFNISISNGLPISNNILVPYNIANVFNDFESNDGDFISETGWEWGIPAQVGPYSGVKVWATNLNGNYPNLIDYVLVTPEYTLESSCILTFRHIYGMENNYDGGNVSISVDNGNNWTVITPLGGYPSNNIVSLNSQPGFTGSISSWQTVQFNLSQYEYQTVRFRFRMTSDSSTTGIGWFIDNFELSGVNQKTGYIYGLVTPTSTTPASKTLIMANNHFATHPDDNGSYKLYLPFGTYDITASLPYHQSSSAFNIQITPESPLRQSDFTLIDLPKPVNTDFIVNNETGEVSLSWAEPYDPVLPIGGYKVYKKFNTGPFELVHTTDITSYTDYISLNGLYKYYIRALYYNMEGCPSDTIEFMFPYEDINEPPIPGLITKLKSNYPNPFNPTTTISFDLAEPGKAKLSIYNIKGQLVKVLLEDNFAPGNYNVVWNGLDRNNQYVSSGVYFYRLETKNKVFTRRMMLLK